MAPLQHGMVSGHTIQLPLESALLVAWIQPSVHCLESYDERKTGFDVINKYLKELPLVHYFKSCLDKT